MSQSGRLKITSGNLPPNVPTRFNGNLGYAVPNSNQINFLTQNSTLIFSCSGNTVLLDFLPINLSLGSNLSSLTTGVDNVFLGSRAGNSVTSGSENIGIGSYALNNITSGSYNFAAGSSSAVTIQDGTDNIAIGRNSLFSSTSGTNNICFGSQTLYNAENVSDNIAISQYSLYNLTTGVGNIAIGPRSCQFLISGNENVAIGANALQDATTGNQNVAIGFEPLINLISGSYNVAIGLLAGDSYTSSESNNILIDNVGQSGDNHTTRIGTSQTSCFIAGINGVNVGSVATVVTSSGDKLGTATITAGSNITITPSANAITISASGGGGLSWTEVTGTSQSAAVGNGYIANNAGLVTITLPANFAVGDSVRVAGLGAGGWSLVANTGDIINFGSSATSAGGSLSSTNRYDAVEVIGAVTNTTWVVVSSIGNLTVV